MSSEEVHALVLYRLEQADEALRAAKLLCAETLYRQAAGRAYYAMFYAVLALLAYRGLEAWWHAGAIALFDREFVKAGPFAREHSRRLHGLFDLRQRADYLEMFEVSADRAKSAISSAEAFLADVRSHLEGLFGL